MNNKALNTYKIRKVMGCFVKDILASKTAQILGIINKYRKYNQPKNKSRITKITYQPYKQSFQSNLIYSGLIKT